MLYPDNDFFGLLPKQLFDHRKHSFEFSEPVGIGKRRRLIGGYRRNG